MINPVDTGLPAGSSFLQYLSWAREQKQLPVSWYTALAMHREWDQKDMGIAWVAGQDLLDLPQQILDWREELQAVTTGARWQQSLNQVIRSSGKTHLTWTRKRNSRRYGTPPGIRIRHRGHLAIILDTSGSMSETTLTAFLSHLPRLRRTHTQITLIEADHHVRRVTTNLQSVQKDWQGRSGTAYQPALDYAAKRVRPELVLYLTDGEGLSPIWKYPCPLIWLISNPEADPIHLANLPGNWLPMNSLGSQNIYPLDNVKSDAISS